MKLLNREKKKERRKLHISQWWDRRRRLRLLLYEIDLAIRNGFFFPFRYYIWERDQFHKVAVLNDGVYLIIERYGACDAPPSFLDRAISNPRQHPTKFTYTNNGTGCTLQNLLQSKGMIHSRHKNRKGNKHNFIGYNLD